MEPNRSTQTHQSGLLREGFPYSWLGGYRMVPWYTSASMDVEITDDLFHVSFGIIRQLGIDLLFHTGANRTTQAITILDF